jgi:hypothetical protein
MPIILALRRLRPENHKFQDNLKLQRNPVFKKKKKKTFKWGQGCSSVIRVLASSIHEVMGLIPSMK